MPKIAKKHFRNAVGRWQLLSLHTPLLPRATGLDDRLVAASPPCDFLRIFCRNRAQSTDCFVSDTIFRLFPPLMEPISFRSWPDFRAWLAENHSRSDGIWLRIYKKDSKVTTVTYPEALDHALCYGWIDGQKKPYDGQSWLQRFTPRRSKSSWSKKNTEHAQRLIASGIMAPTGMKEE